MITVRLIRGARALLGWSQDELADKAEVSRPTVQRIEAGPDDEVGGTAQTVAAMERAFKNAGIRWDDGSESGECGVWLAKGKAKR